MAQKTVLVDDINGDDEGVERHTFSIDSNVYEIDLSPTHFAELESALAKFVRKARKAPARSMPRTRPRVTKGDARQPEPRVVRQWARLNGVPVPARGRIPADVVERYLAESDQGPFPH